MRNVFRWWLPLAGAAAAAMLLLLAIGLAEFAGGRPPEGREVRAERLGERDDSLHLAGTGTWLPLARELVRAYGNTHPAARIVVHDSIGSGGGRRAVADGMIDIGLVSTPAGALPELECCDVVPVAIGAVVFATHPYITTSDLTGREIVEIFSGNTTTWGDGTAIVPLLREPGDSATRIMGRIVPGFQEAVDEAVRHGRWPTLLSDLEIAQATSATQGSIGLHDLGALLIDHPTLNVIALDGVVPTAESIEDGSYPIRRWLALVVPRPAHPRARELVSFIASPTGQEVVAASGGYVPIRETMEEGR